MDDPIDPALTMPDPFITVDEAARLLGREKRVIQRWTNSNPPILPSETEPHWPNRKMIRLIDLRLVVDQPRRGWVRDRKPTRHKTATGKTVAIRGQSRKEG